MMLARQLLAILLLPFTMTVMVPLWIARRDHTTLTAPGSALAVVSTGAGVALLAVGLGLFLSSLFYFWSIGRGTLAPWDPPRNFVVAGPYRFVRNPMISGVIFVLAAEALILRSLPHAEWAGTFAGLNMIYIPLLEEPRLRARFGQPYVRYTQAVRRFLPRLRPWTPAG
jgi:protein-S-isoprenylcysteine O-methyltransferase Ste14